MATTVGYAEYPIGHALVGEIRLASDSGVNPLSGAAVAAIRARLQTAGDAARQGQAGPHLLLLAASGRCFCAGADVKEFQTFDAAAFQNYMSNILALYAEMIAVPKPILALVEGDARGGGAALAYFSDFVIAAETAKFALPEALRGLAGGGYLMPRLIGRHRAAEMVLLGRSYSAAQMQDWGLITQAAPAAELPARLEALCNEIAAIPPAAFIVGKASLAAGLTQDMQTAMARHVTAQTEAFLRGRMGVRQAT